jgi:predicted aspartyl protease
MPTPSSVPFARELRAAGFLLSLALAGVAAPLAAEPMEVLPSGHTVARVEVDGRGPYRFVIDTGASNTNLTAQLRAARPDLARRDADRHLNGAAGTVRTELVTLDALGVQGRTFRGLSAFVLPRGPMDMLGVDGVLGADVISTYAMEMDVPNRRWALHAEAPAELERGMLPAVRFRLDSARMPRLTVHVDGKFIPALLDTGAKGTFINWKAARLIGLSPEDPRLATGGFARGATTQGGSKTKISMTHDVRVGSFRWAVPKLRIADLPIFDMIGMGQGPAMILGIDALKDRRFIVDYPRGRLLIAAG